MREEFACKDVCVGLVQLNASCSSKNDSRGRVVVKMTRTVENMAVFPESGGPISRTVLPSEEDCRVETKASTASDREPQREGL
jgi:hypothetical protein